MSEEVEVPQTTEQPQENPTQAPQEAEVDPRAAAFKEELVLLLNAAQGIWKDALKSQIDLTQRSDLLQSEINEIKQLSALPQYPGIKVLQQQINRINNCNKRVLAVKARLDRLSQQLTPPQEQ